MIEFINEDTNSSFQINSHYQKLINLNSSEIIIKGYKDNEINKVLNEIINSDTLLDLNQTERKLYETLTGYDLNDNYDLEVKRFVDFSKFKSDYSNYFDEEYFLLNNEEDLFRVEIVKFIIKISVASNKSLEFISNVIILYDYLQSKLKYQTNKIFYLAIISYIITNIIYFTKFDNEEIEKGLDEYSNSNNNLYDSDSYNNGANFSDRDRIFIIIKEMLKDINEYLNVNIFDNIFNYSDLINSLYKEYDKENILIFYYSKFYLKYSPKDINEDNFKLIFELGNKEYNIYRKRNMTNRFISRKNLLLSISLDDSKSIKLDNIKKIKFTYTKKDIINSGSYGDIIKISNNQIVKSFKLKYGVLNELIFLNYLNHPNIIKIKGQNNNNIILDYYKSDLFHFIIDNNDKLNYNKRINISMQIISGLLYIHELNIYHLDLKPENILTDNNQEIKIIDFGFAQYNKHDIVSTRDVNFIVYYPPEFYIGANPKYLKPSRMDSWMLTLVLIFVIEFIKLDYPYKEVTYPNIEKFFVMIIKQNYSNNKILNEIISNTLILDNIKRISVKEIYNKLNLERKRINK